MDAIEFYLLFSKRLIVFSFRRAMRENGSFIDDYDGSLGVWGISSFGDKVSARM